jgi:hypothetical protein
MTEIAAEIRIGHLAVWEMMEVVGYQKVCVCWVNHFLMEEHELQEENVSSQSLKQNAHGGNDLTAF